MKQLYWFIWRKITGKKFWVGQPIFKGDGFQIKIYTSMDAINTMFLPIFKMQNGDIDWQKYSGTGYDFCTFYGKISELQYTPQETREAVIELLSIYYELKELKI